jgi:hypothetical protein
MDKFRNLANYKAMMMSVAREKGKAAELEAATTLTQAKKIVFGHKAKNKTAKK